ncbi:MAG: hypothetical protein NVSMB9_33690 [Isosphaeraceae bacterium]
MKPFCKSLALATLLLPVLCQADEFDRIEGGLLTRAARAEETRSRKSLSLKDLDALPPLLNDSRSPFFLVKTSEGNLARILASPALRKTCEPGKTLPVVVLDRFETFAPGKAGARLASGAGLLLFDSFQIDLDSGQVVPPGQGGDLTYQHDAQGGPALVALDKSSILTLSRSPLSRHLATGPSPGRAILPTDFAGRYRLFADGRSAGLLEIEVAPDRTLTGKLRSEPNGSSYPLSGAIASARPHHATFTLKFPRTEQTYQAYLGTEDKNVLAGTFTLLDRTYGFFAVREGARIDPGKDANEEKLRPPGS